MYRFTVLLFLSLLVLEIDAQKKPVREAGFFVGSSYYMGDINPTRQFYAPSPSFGLLVKYHLNDRHCLRFHSFYGQFKGNDLDFSNEFQKRRGASFSSALLDVDAIYEFNFMPFTYNPRSHSFSPYLFGGLGYELILQSQYSRNQMTLPFGTGIKYMINRKITVGLEWSFRKLFSDNVDGLQNPGKTADKSTISNNDWYSFAGFFITFRLFDQGSDCPVYKQER